MSSPAGETEEIHSPENSSVSSVCLEKQIQTQQSVRHIGCLSTAQKIKITSCEVRKVLSWLCSSETRLSYFLNTENELAYSLQEHRRLQKGLHLSPEVGIPGLRSTATVWEEWIYHCMPERFHTNAVINKCAYIYTPWSQTQLVLPE